MDSKILDVGCGVSSVLHFVPGKEKIGVDPLVDYYQHYYNYPDDIKLVNAFGEDVNFWNQDFDVAFCTNVIDHVENPGKTISEIYRVLKDGGYFILTIECFDTPEERDPAHPWSLTANDARKLLKDFNIVFEKFSPWLGLRLYVDGGKDSQATESEYVFIAKK